jgi:RNA polymerase sigma factor (TIGR02999 family)
MSEGGAREITRILARVREGDQVAAGDLFDRLYPELHEIAERLFRSQQRHHTLQATALVNEAFLKMIKPSDRDPGFEDRTHFLAVAATAMRQILVNHARDRSALKRGGGVDRRRVTLAGVVVGNQSETEVLAVDEALSELEALAPRQAKIAELKFFGGLRNREAADALGVSLRTVELDWKMAKVWLAERLASGTEG